MKAVSEPIQKELVLLGGGHSHAIALKLLGMHPIPGVRLTLITEASDTPYSGMLPGYVAGFYTRDQCYIDLRPLCQFAQAQLYLDQAIGLDLVNRRVLCANRPPVAFDLLSIDIGSTPTIPGFSATDLPPTQIAVKPIRRFLEQWHELITQVERNPDRPLQISLVGGGTGGVELALAVQRRIHQILEQARQPLENLQMHLIHRDRVLLSTHPVGVQRRFQKILTDRGIHLHLNETVVALAGATLKLQSGRTLTSDYTFWVTQAAAPTWLATSGLALDDRGFIQVHPTLQSVSHPQVFAAGDIATIVGHPRPKAGVFAVRQGKPLFQNLSHQLQGEPLVPYYPQRQYLNLIGTSDRSAVAVRGSFSWESPWLWQWKDWIDQRFMQRFIDLPPMEEQPVTFKSGTEPAAFDRKPMPCAGCGSKVGSATLTQVLQRIQQEQPVQQRSPEIILGLDAAEDAAVVQVPSGQVMLHTVDHFRALVNDPFVFGQIAANHSLSDLFAMGATPQTALAIVTLPYGLPATQEETLYQLLSGAVQVLQQSGAVLAGGHTTEGAELVFGLACNGWAAPDRLLKKAGMQPGQALILTKPLGIGTLFAAAMQLQAKGSWIDAAIATMLQSNQRAATCLLQHGATACTDVTGFGLAGHLREMLQASQVSVQLQLGQLPILVGACETIQRIPSSLQPQNLQAERWIAEPNSIRTHPHYPLLFDPQTAGGLLATVPADQATACLQSLREWGYNSALIGIVLEPTDRSLIYATDTQSF